MTTRDELNERQVLPRLRHLGLLFLDHAHPEKMAISRQRIGWGLHSNLRVISYQFVHECFNFSFRNAHRIIAIREVETLFNILWAPLWKIHSSPELLQLALSLRGEINASWYGSLVLAAALKATCRFL